MEGLYQTGDMHMTGKTEICVRKKFARLEFST